LPGKKGITWPTGENRTRGQPNSIRLQHGQSEPRCWQGRSRFYLGIFTSERRLADEYDGGLNRGEVATKGKPVNVPGKNIKTTAKEIGLNRKQIYEAAPFVMLKRMNNARLTLGGLRSRYAAP
jgi:hypothetical protein